MGNSPKPNPFEGLGLPSTFALVECPWRTAKVDVVTDLGPRTFHVLLVDGPHGRLGFAFSAETWGTLARAMYEQHSGLSLAGPPELGHRNGGP